jgi:hypothetical protein
VIWYRHSSIDLWVDRVIESGNKYYLRVFCDLEKSDNGSGALASTTHIYKGPLLYYQYITSADADELLISMSW